MIFVAFQERTPRIYTVASSPFCFSGNGISYKAKPLGGAHCGERERKIIQEEFPFMKNYS
ncbi:hypothetical protein DQQ01_03805 [Blautia argi]|uniref:Uncharacterized protein n=1 Tax=Blautia argi TaxID=1912897 RepID=A0A2Z4U8U7_9FIRM|nr:hypothetical protein DQQ01_03805 [Blautia argi]